MSNIQSCATKCMNISIRKHFTLMFALMIFCHVSYAEQTKSIPKFVIDFLGENTDADTLRIGKQFYTSFESISDFNGFYIVPIINQGTATQSLSNDQRVSGELAHKAFIYGTNTVSMTENTNHRAYPTIQLAKTKTGILTDAVLIEFSVWADFDLRKVENESWFSLATFTSYDDQYWYRAYLINVDADYRVHLMHVPNHDEVIYDIYQTDSVSLPRKKWAKITAYIDYTSANKFKSPFISVWQDGELVSAARFNDRVNLVDAFKNPNKPACLSGLSADSPVDVAEKACHLNYVHGLAQAHFGLYAPPLLGSGTIYNDDLTISEIKRR